MNGQRWQGKRILVVGIGRSGFDVARVLHSQGAQVTACDRATPALAQELASTGVRVLTNWRGAMPAEPFDLVVTSPGVPADAPVLQEAVQKGVPVWSEVELAYYLSPAPIVAVTGTNGKSTTAALIAHILKSAGYHAALCGNISAEGMERTLTDAAASAQPEDILVAEVSSFQLEWVHEFRPHVGVWTTLSPDHLDRHRSFEEYGRVKARLFRCQTEGDYAVLPGDDAFILSLVDTRAKRIYFSHQNLNIKDIPCICCLVDGVYLMQGEEASCLASVRGFRLLGLHNRRNLASAVAACSAWKVTREQMEEAISTFEPLPHRMEWVAEIAGVQYVNNSMCTNLHALQESIRAVPAPAVFIIGGVDKSESAFGEIVPLLQEKARAVVLIGADAERIEKQLREAGWEQIIRSHNLEEAVLRAAEIARQGDWVMLSPGCASFDMFANFQERGRAFREVVHRLEAHHA
ncbi:MAG: UDP-N-acetylmuramoyl-L-alanine--D-glutamate ligase [Chthonomonadetes bacterium]|nr:UDP-N-acetylmuramoyl-L-alanine--D-glutamate ligase [Chthonomonadetes bacterium]